MTAFLGIWFGVGTAIATVARRYLGATWLRSIGGGFIWPTYGPLIGLSWLRYKHQRRSLAHDDVAA